jgi:hypothetical protein
MKKFIAMLAAILMFSGTIGCGSLSFDPSKPKYYKDKRTDLCFARMNQGYTQVPCNLQVKRLINE